MPTAHDLLRLAVTAVCSEKTARRWWSNPDGVQETSRIRLERAASELGLPLPPSPASSSQLPSSLPTSSSHA